MALALVQRHHLDLMMINITHAQKLEVILVAISVKLTDYSK